MDGEALPGELTLEEKAARYDAMGEALQMMRLLARNGRLTLYPGATEGSDVALLDALLLEVTLLRAEAATVPSAAEPSAALLTVALSTFWARMGELLRADPPLEIAECRRQALIAALLTAWPVMAAHVRGVIVGLLEGALLELGTMLAQKGESAEALRGIALARQLVQTLQQRAGVAPGEAPASKADVTIN